MRVRGDAPHDDLCPSNDGSPGPVDCDFCERLYSADARGYTRGWSAGHAEGQRDEREACAAYIAARGLPITAAAIRARELFALLDPRCDVEQHNHVAKGEQCPHCHLNLWVYIEAMPKVWP